MPPRWETSLETVRERQDLSTRWIVGVAAGTALFLALCMGGLWLFYTAAGTPDPPSMVSKFPPPALQSNPETDLHAWEASQSAQLAAYAWVDRTQGIVRIPIERAMQLLVARGAKAYEPPDRNGQ